MSDLAFRSLLYPTLNFLRFFYGQNDQTDKVLFLEGVEPVGQSRDPAKYTLLILLYKISLELSVLSLIDHEILGSQNLGRLGTISVVINRKMPKKGNVKTDSGHF